MQSYVKRSVTEKIKQKLKSVPVVVILGPRQCGKSSLAKEIISGIDNKIYLDLERPSDINRLRDSEAFFRYNSNKLICLDEIQRVPDLFSVLRSISDESNRNGQFLILGSASPDLIKQSSETLAGRISYIELAPFQLEEVEKKKKEKSLIKHWTRGGFPRSYLANNEKESFDWRIDFIRTFLERDIPQLGFRIEARRLERFWLMCAHIHGQTLNSSKLGDSLGVSNHTIRSYIDLLEQTFVLRVLHPYTANIKKRLVKAPKIYIRDAGLLHALLGIEDYNDLLGNPSYGSSWEGFAIENILSSLEKKWKASFFRTSSGAEIDLILEKGNKRIAVECKSSTSPDLTKGFWNSMDELDIKMAYVIAPIKDYYPLKDNVMITSLSQFIKKLSKK
tara:strand:+ start:182 stop:1354 length:1173 start_codon:yes stop_codon:yes gene_type:complete